MTRHFRFQIKFKLLSDVLETYYKNVTCCFNYPSVTSIIKYSTPSLLLSYISKPCLNKGWIFLKNLPSLMEVSTVYVIYI